jgi:hypothetical protein
LESHDRAQLTAFGDRGHLFSEYLGAAGRLKVADLGLKLSFLFGR